MHFYNNFFLFHPQPIQIYYAGVNKKSGMSELIAIINATDKDFGVNASIEYLIAASHLYKFGASKSTGNIVPSPFCEFFNFFYCSLLFSEFLFFILLLDSFHYVHNMDDWILLRFLVMETIKSSWIECSNCRQRVSKLKF